MVRMVLLLPQIGDVRTHLGRQGGRFRRVSSDGWLGRDRAGANLGNRGGYGNAYGLSMVGRAVARASILGRFTCRMVDYVQNRHHPTDYFSSLSDRRIVISYMYLPFVWKQCRNLLEQITLFSTSCRVHPPRSPFAHPLVYVPTQTMFVNRSTTLFMHMSVILILPCALSISPPSCFPSTN